MLELKKFFLLLKKHRLTLIIVPVICIIVTYFLVRNMADSYVSQGQIATGIVDDTQQSVLDNDGNRQPSEINQQFSNLTEMMRMKKMLDQVSYLLMIHEIKSGRSFRKPSNMLKRFSPAELNNIVRLYREKYNKTEGLNLYNKKEKQLYDILQSMGYDYKTLSDKLRIYRAGDSDFLDVEFESENAELSAFVVNSLCSEFVEYYTFLVKINQRKAHNFLDTLLIEKSNAMNLKVAALRDYKIRNRVLNLNEQSSQLYSKILDYDTRKRQAIKDIASLTGALNEIDNKFNPRDRRYLEATLTRVNQNLLTTKEELKGAYDVYIQNGFDQDYKQVIDSLQQVLSRQINQSTDQYIYNPLVAKQDLVAKKMQLEIDLDIARYSIGPLEREQQSLNAEFDKLVPHEAVVQSLERDVDVASKEYLDVLNKFNQSSMETGFTAKLSFVQKAMPGLAQPSKKMLLVIISGAISFIFCLLILFILFYLDNSITEARELANKTSMPVLGVINIIPNGNIDLKKVWEDPHKNPTLQVFKDQIRSLRFETERAMDQAKVLAITSLGSGEGKTMIAISLAFAWKMVNKKVLLIDGNFINPQITGSVKPEGFLEDFFTGKIDTSNLLTSSGISVLGNRGGDASILEIARQNVIEEKLEELKQFFDIVIIETSRLAGVNQPKEWILLCDAVTAVFASNERINEEKRLVVNYLKHPDQKFRGWIFNKSGDTVVLKTSKSAGVV